MTHPSTPRAAIFGEVLYDEFPDGSSVLGGAPFNVAWNLQAFGMQPLFISRIGTDELGKQIESAMQQWGMDCHALQTDPQHATGTVTVSINQDEPNFDIVNDRAYDFIDANQFPDLDNISLLYHGSLALRNPISRSALSSLLSTHNLPTFIDVNLRSPWWKAEEIMPLLHRAHWIKLNDDELNQLTPMADSIQARAQELLQNTEAELVLVTRGAKGALACLPEGRIETIVPNKIAKIRDTVGAGDAFASVIILGILKTWDPLLTLHRAQDFASAVVGLRGATVTDHDFYQSFLREWQS